MNNLNRNTRTLIVSFLIAIFALIPFRFIEIGQIQDQYLTQSQVLGEKTEKFFEEPRQTISGLEAPYNQTEKCYSQEEISVLEKEAEILLNKIEVKKNNICQ